MRKRFLSLLLALTMVLSLTVVPARATDGDLSWGTAPTMTVKSGETTVTTVEKGSQLTFTVGALSIKKETSSGSKTEATSSDYTAEYKWENLPTGLTTTTNTVTGTTSGAGTFNVKCTITIKKDGNEVSGMKRELTATVTVKDFTEAVKTATVSYQGRTYQIQDNNTSGVKVTIDKFTGDPALSTDNVKLGTVSGYSDATLTKSGETWTIKSSSADDAKSVTLSVTENPVTGQSLTINGGNNITIYEGQKVDLTATYSRVTSNDAKNVKYEWTTTGGSVVGSGNTVKFTAPSSVSGDTTYTVTCIVKEGSSVAATKSITITVKDDPYKPDYNSGVRVNTINTNSSNKTCTFAAPVLYSSTESAHTISSGGGFTVAWAVKSGDNLVTVDQTGKVTAKNGVRSGTATITATITYMGKTYPALEYTVNVSALDAQLNDITNGDYESYSQSSIEDYLYGAIKKAYSSFSGDITSVTVSGTPSHLTLQDGSKTLKSGDTVTNGLEIYADRGYIGEASFQLNAVAGATTYTVTLYLNVTSDGTIKESVSGATANKSVTFTNSDYQYLYIYTGSASFKDSMYTGSWGGYAPSNWTRVAKNGTYTVNASAFKDGKATLYVVGVDSNDVASTGTIEVTQKDYSIKYNVVAGESVSFDQDDFEDFLTEYAEDNGNYNSRKDELVFDYAELTSAVPNSKTAGTLYYGSTEITTSNRSKTEMEDMDKVSFTAAAKANDTVTLTFKVYGDLYKNGASKATEVKYDVDVVISVVKEDIVYTVGVNSSVKFDDEDFQDYLNGYSSSYKKSTLDYVTFEVGRNSAISAYYNGTGALYRYYSAYGVNSAATASDEFHYEPKTSSKYYDLADVTYVTTRFAKAGDTVYIPFTAYGTKNEKATGTVAIKVKQTMNFTDVRTTDYFYDAVQWAVNNNVTKGTSNTTFTPSKGCTRAEIVTFLWRAAGSPEPRSTTNVFTDVSATKHADYYKAILWASQNGITAGKTATTFAPNDTCTRAQIVTFLYRYKGNPSVSGSLSFTDVDKTAHSAYYNAILWAVRNSVTTGNGNNTFAPGQTCNRGEAVTFLYRALA